MIPLARRKLRCRGGGVGGYFFLLANLSVPVPGWEDFFFFFAISIFFVILVYFLNKLFCYLNFQLRVLASFSFRLTNGKKFVF